MDTAQETPQHYIVRTRSAGVFFGRIVSRDGQEIVMHEARRLWYWAGAASLSELALRGVNKPQECKFPDPLPQVMLFEVIEIIPCSAEAILSINGVAPWRA